MGIKKILFVCGLILVCMAFTIFGLFQYATTPGSLPGSSPGEENMPYVVTVNRGIPLQKLADQLAESKIISQPLLFEWYGRLTGKARKIKQGEYEVSGRMSPLQLYGVFTSGLSRQRSITIREGENLYEISRELESQNIITAPEFLKLSKDPAFVRNLLRGVGIEANPLTLEGYLFPETYFFTKFTTLPELLKMMVKRLHAEWKPEFAARAKEIGFTQHQVLTFASIVEKETGAPDERPLIASVFFNRLQKKMRLQSDPTIIYGMGERYEGKIGRRDIQETTAYNTYQIPALPPGPIGNPGRESIRATLFPAQSEFLFFVSKNQGRHEFTKSFREHNQAVRRFQLDPKAREGRSWRDLNVKNK